MKGAEKVEGGGAGIKAKGGVVKAGTRGDRARGDFGWTEKDGSGLERAEDGGREWQPRK